MVTTLVLMIAASTIQIEVGRFNAADFPNAKRIERRMPHAAMTARVEKMLGDKRCAFRGQNKAAFDIVVPYAVQLNPAGAPQRVVVKEIDCAPLEQLVGEIAIQLGEAGDFRASHSEGKLWYVSELYFTRGNEMLALKTDDRDKVICKQSEPVLGTRTRIKRICRTAADWIAVESDREQFRRDLRHKGTVPTVE